MRLATGVPAEDEETVGTSLMLSWNMIVSDLEVKCYYDEVGFPQLYQGRIYALLLVPSQLCLCTKRGGLPG